MSTGLSNDKQDEPRGPPSKQDDEGLYLTIKAWVESDIEFSNDWRKQAKKDFAFIAGPGQWEAVDSQALKTQERPVVTFNRSLKYVRAVCGLENNNRHEVIYLPRQVDQPGVVKANEMLTSASEWMGQGCNAERHQSRAFRDAVICGMGWTEATIDRDDDPKGKYVETRCNPLEMGWDRAAREQNLSDSKRRWRSRKMLVSEARDLFPDAHDDDLDASWAASVEAPKDQPKTLQEKQLRADARMPDDPKREVHIVQIQWWEYEKYHRVFDPMQNKNVDVGADAFAGLKSQAEADGHELQHAPLRRKVYKQAFVGNVILESGPCPRRDGFTFNCITYEPDDDSGTWFGLTRVVRDPQIWANKFFAQMMHIINSTAKGGILAETDAFPDIREAQNTYARQDAITEVSPGAIGKNKIMSKPGVGLSQGVMALMEVANSAFSDVLGINLELMGLADRDQPGVLEAQRKQAAMTILATLFDSLALFHQDVGRMRLSYIQAYLADGRMIRLSGKDGIVAMPLLKDKTLGEYDVIVGDAPTSPNTKEKVWSALQMLLPVLVKANLMTPEMASMVLDYVPGIPSKLVEAFKQIATKPPPQDVVEHKQIAIAGALQEIKEKKAVANLKDAQADAARAGVVVDMVKIGADLYRAQADQVEQRALEGLGAKPMMMPDAGPVVGPMGGLPTPPMPPQLGSLVAAAQAAPAANPSPMPPPAPSGLIPPGGLAQPGA